MTANGDGDLVLTVDGRELAGWEQLEVTLSIEQMPNTFQVVGSRDNPSLSDAKGIREGAACTVRLGSDRVITGYVDTAQSFFSPAAHGVRLVGRGKCQDLVDCSAIWPGSQISGSSALEIAAKLAKPYGITAKALSDPGPVVPQFNVSVTDTVADILEQVTRHSGLLYYEDNDGNLVLAEAADADAASGFVEGANVQAATVLKSVAQRYSDYKCSYLSLDTSGLFTYADGLYFFHAKDPFVPRFRQLNSVAESVGDSLEFAKRRALWDASRRAGRGRAVTVTVDSWRDKAGKLWTPNTLAPISLPSLGVVDAVYCISTVIFRRELESGTTAEVTLLPREAFLPAPIKLQPTIGGLTPVNGPGATG